MFTGSRLKTRMVSHLTIGDTLALGLGTRKSFHDSIVTAPSARHIKAMMERLCAVGVGMPRICSRWVFRSKKVAKRLLLK